MAHIATGCDHCGGIDDHPKLHYGIETYHHDCIPIKVRVELGEHPVVAQIVAAAESGTRGNDLRKHIQKLHATNKDKDN